MWFLIIFPGGDILHLISHISFLLSVSFGFYPAAFTPFRCFFRSTGLPLRLPTLNNIPS